MFNIKSQLGGHKQKYRQKNMAKNEFASVSNKPIAQKISKTQQALLYLWSIIRHPCPPPYITPP